MASILIVDDSTIVRRVLRNVVSNYFHGNALILEAENGQIAMDILNNGEDSVDLMLLDWNMPVMDGEQVVEQVRANKKFNKMQIIMATTEGGKGDVLKMVKKGVNGYLVKPFREEHIVKTLDKVARRLRN